MAKKKTHHVKPVIKRRNLRQDAEQCYLISKKILNHFGLDPKLLDVFTKKQKEFLYRIYFLTPTITPDKDGMIPRHYIKMINNEAYLYMKYEFWGNPDSEITYMELATSGLSFLTSMQSMLKNQKLLEIGTPQYESATLICEKYECNKVLREVLDKISDRLFLLTRRLSRVNFRVYGHSMDCREVKDPYSDNLAIKLLFEITSKECETKYFSFNNIYRKAYRMFNPEYGLFVLEPLTIPQTAIYKTKKEGELFNIYIQSHVFHRFKERLDIFSTFSHNLIFQYVFTRNLKLVRSDKQVLFACLIEGISVGYFTFSIVGNDIVVNTFLPFIDYRTPEGKEFQEILPLSIEEITYLGMDKISFFTQVDFEQIPILKKVLDNTSIRSIKLALENLLYKLSNEKLPYDTNKTNFVNDFFNKR